MQRINAPGGPIFKFLKAGYFTDSGWVCVCVCMFSTEIVPLVVRDFAFCLTPNFQNFRMSLWWRGDRQYKTDWCIWPPISLPCLKPVLLKYFIIHYMWVGCVSQLSSPNYKQVFLPSQNKTHSTTCTGVFQNPANQELPSLEN